jgi:lipopolysaccharide assembly protein A
MKNAIRLLKWVLKACIFFTLFAFALNNQHEASLHLFFGHQWRSPMVLIVLAAFAIGLVVGVLGMAPRRWRRGDMARRVQAPPSGSTGNGDTMATPGAPHGL